MGLAARANRLGNHDNTVSQANEAMGNVGGGGRGDTGYDQVDDARTRIRCS